MPNDLDDIATALGADDLASIKLAMVPVDKLIDAIAERVPALAPLKDLEPEHLALAFIVARSCSRPVMKFLAAAVAWAASWRRSPANG